jgi:hypothetical protein
MGICLPEQCKVAVTNDASYIESDDTVDWRTVVFPSAPLFYYGSTLSLATINKQHFAKQ